MNRSKFKIGTLVMAVAALGADHTLVAQTIATEYRPREGEMHADFVYPRIDNGEPVKLSQYRGKKVMLIHFASW